MTHLVVKGRELVKALSNVALWHDPNEKISEGCVVMHVTESHVEFFAFDGFVAAMDSIPGVDYEDASRTYRLSTDDVDRLLLAARAVGTKDIQLDAGARIEVPYGFTLDDKGKWSLAAEGSRTYIGDGAEFPQWCDAFYDALMYAEPVSVGGVWAIRPERFLKLSRVRADKDAPIDMCIIEAFNPMAPAVAAIKIGPTFRALVNFVNRDVAKENLGDLALDYLWW